VGYGGATVKGQAKAILYAVWSEMNRRNEMLESAEGLTSVSLIVNIGRDGKPGRVLFRTESSSPAAEQQPKPTPPPPPPSTPRTSW